MGLGEMGLGEMGQNPLAWSPVHTGGYSCRIRRL